MEISSLVTIGLRLLNKENTPFNFEDSNPEISNFIDYFRNANIFIQEHVRQLVKSGNYSRLVGYAQQMASQAVRLGSIDDLRRGLAAIVLEGVRCEFRGTLMALCLLHHSAGKLGVDPKCLFAEAARLGDDKSQKFVLQYLATGEKHIRAMGFEEGETSKGFKYVVVA